MARKPQQTENTAVVVTDADTPALPAMRDAANRLAVMHVEQEATVRAVAAQLGYQLPADCTDPDLIQRDIAANMRRSAEACLEVGRGLRVLRAACEHGQFMARLDVLGIEASVARRFMESAVKFSKRATSHVLGAAGSQSKLFEMLILDDEQIEELELTGQTGELSLDDIATMSVKELRAALREARFTVEAKERHLADKERHIERLNEKALVIQKMKPLELGEEVRKEASVLMTKAELEVLALRPALSKLAEHASEHGVSHDEFMAGALAQVQRALNQLRSEFDIKAAPDGEEVPDWLRAGDAALETAGA